MNKFFNILCEMLCFLESQQKFQVFIMVLVQRIFQHSMRNVVLLRKSTEIWSLYNGFSSTNFSTFGTEISSLYDGYSYKGSAEFCAIFCAFFDRCLKFKVFRMVSIKRVFQHSVQYLVFLWQVLVVVSLDSKLGGAEVN